MKRRLEQLYAYHRFTKEEAKQLLIQIAEGKYVPAQLASFLTVFMMRGITLAELSGFQEALMELAKPVDLGTQEIMDLCGTGGDHKNTLNISTLTAFIVAGAGIPVAKHGNHGVTSLSGSSTVLQQLGIPFAQDNITLKMQLEKANLCFMHAPLFHPALKNVANLRKELAVKTFFNLLGPLANPAHPRYQFTGTFNLETARLYHFFLQQQNKRYFVFHTMDGYDEVSLTAGCKYFTQGGEGYFEPEDYGMERVRAIELEAGESPQAAAERFLNLLQAKGTPHQHQVLLMNAALAIHTFSQKDFNHCFQLAQDSLFNLKAFKTFQILKQLNPA